MIASIYRITIATDNIPILHPILVEKSFSTAVECTEAVKGLTGGSDSLFILCIDGDHVRAIHHGRIVQSSLYDALATIIKRGYRIDASDYETAVVKRLEQLEQANTAAKTQVDP